MEKKWKKKSEVERVRERRSHSERDRLNEREI
jgi:hypothetical protein